MADMSTVCDSESAYRAMRFTYFKKNNPRFMMMPSEANKAHASHKRKDNAYGTQCGLQQHGF